MPTLTREALYDLVWTDAVRTVAGRYGVSDVWLKKLCQKASVPLPERGYWAKIQAGRKLPKTPLPPREPGASNIVSIGKEPYSWRYDPEEELAKPLPDPPVFAEPIEAVIARVTRRVGKVGRARDLASPWGALRELLQADEVRREKLRASPYATWNTPLFDSPFERRRLRILSTLFMGLAKAGARPHIRGDEGRDISITVGDRSVGVTLDHPSAKPDRNGRYKTRPGKVDTLKLQIEQKPDETGFQGAWIDTDNAKLEDQLSQIAIAIIVAGEVHYRAGQVRHHQWLIQRRAENEAEVRRRREEAERKAREKRLKEEQERRDFLFSQARDWRTAKDIRGFVADILATRPTSMSEGEVKDWSDWALAEADAIDPVIKGLPKPDM